MAEGNADQADDEGTPTWVWILGGVGCLAVSLPCVGILAAIAIPQFMKNIQKAKVAEAEATLQSTASAVREHYQLEGELPGVGMTLRTAEEPPTTGTKIKLSGGHVRELSEQKRTLWNQLDWPTSKTSMYFQYVYTATRTDTGARAEVRAVADFQKGGPKHTITQKIVVSDGDLQIRPTVTQNSFE